MVNQALHLTKNPLILGHFDADHENADCLVFSNSQPDGIWDEEFCLNTHLSTFCEIIFTC
jgi:hypothetical protein